MAFAASLMLVACAPAVSAVSPAQVDYNGNLLWVQGTTVSYRLHLAPTIPKINDDPDTWLPLFNNTVDISANVTYTVNAISSGVANITEAIEGIEIRYNQPILAASPPYVAYYNQSVSLDAYIADFILETHGGASMPGTFQAGNHSTGKVTITNKTLFTLPDITNVVLYNLSSNAITPAAGGEIVNKFLVSSNITGPVGTHPNFVVNRTMRSGYFYTPMAFAGQNGTFWLNTGANYSYFNNLGLWAGNDLSMGFNENETYTYTLGSVEDAFRWRSKFGIGYPKVGTYENAWYDTETGILLEYKTQQVRVDFVGYSIPMTRSTTAGDYTDEIPEEHMRYVKGSLVMSSQPEGMGTTYNGSTRSDRTITWDNIDGNPPAGAQYYVNVFYAGVKPNQLNCNIVALSFDLLANATPGIPGYPAWALLVALGTGFALVVKKLLPRKHTA